MKIGLIRHFPVQHRFLKGLVTQTQVLQWFAQYNEAAVEFMRVDVGAHWQVCYSSQLPRAWKTAEAIYSGDVICTALLNEPSPDPVLKYNLKLPFLFWGMLIRFAILSDHATQSQSRSTIAERMRQLVPELINSPAGDVLIVSHAFTMEILSQLLIREGFRGPKLNRPKNGVLYIYEKE